MTNAQKHYDTWPEAIAGMKDAMPEMAKAFGGFFQKLMGEGALTVREKELVAVGISLALRCEPCIYAHVEKAMHAGVTREQLLEVGGVVMMMQGGPGYTYMPKLIEAVAELERRQHG